jgi:glycosyltransferase involved in cell wall biosynthesis
VPGRGGPLRVGFELTGLELDRGGAARYAERMRLELQRHPDVELVALAHSGQARGGAAGRVLRGLSRELIYMPLRLPRRARSLDVDILHCATPVAPLRASMPVAVTVHDVMTWDHPEWFSRANVLQQRLVLGPALRRAELVLTSSEYSRERIVELLGIERERVVVTPLGVDERFSPGAAPRELLERLGVEAPYVLSVGTLQPRKNIEGAIRAFERLAVAGVEHRLVVAGARGWRDRQLLEMVAASPVSERIALVGRISDEEMIGLYRGAELFVFPSLYEGFGIPPLEAMACGTAVVSSDRTSLPEVVGEAGVLVDPADPDALADAVAEILGSVSRRRDLERRGLARAARFTWHRCVDLTIRAYREAAR